MFDQTQHYSFSSLRENIVEHLFVGLALQRLWAHGIVDVEILRSEFDAYGYDLVVSRGNLVRHVQLKSGTSPKKISVSTLLSQRPSGCVVYILIDDKLNLNSFLFYGSEQGSPLPDLESMKTTKRATANSLGVKPLRENHRDLLPSAFSKVDNLERLLELLLGCQLDESNDS
ncbi:hypothetical protein EPK99_07120 [Neorhizobium lilium]|uniref:DUF4365 domain-containing protein n=1 Tax=Neorhizobium lilium TaxID=2503024 RepID=A0A3S3S706_9HYPH|nr:hypothetical protein [Neorhizobium lilium]RWX78385.1 hypothetical protein EPK99_07120 [Neorhizobium lilium]